MTSREAELATAAKKVEAMALDRFTLKRKNLQRLVPGVAAFDESQIRCGLAG